MNGTPRPSGVAILSILAALGGIVFLIGAAVLGILAGTMSEFIESAIEEYGTGTYLSGVGEFVTGIIMAIAAVAAIIGILYLINAYGLWVGKGWAWWLTIILSVLGIIGGLLSLQAGIGIIPIIIYIVIIYYFTRPHVKEFFGLAAPPPPPPPPP